MSVARTDPDYPRVRERAVWNGRVPPRFPESIARPRSVEEVGRVVLDARRCGLMLSVKSGGHDYHGACLRDGALLVDLGSLDSVEVDVEQRLAWVGPGITNGTLTGALEPLGFAFPTGHCGSVGLGGYLLSGGLGWNPTVWGPACWSVRGVRAVTVEGETIEIDDHRHPDLFWAARGGAAAFPAIATQFLIELKPLPAVTSAKLVYPIDALAELLAWARSIEKQGLEIAVIARRASPSVRGYEAVATAALTGFGETRERAETLVRAALASRVLPQGTIEESGVDAITFSELEGEGGWVTGLRYAVDSGWIGETIEEIAELCSRSLVESPSELTKFVFSRGQYPSGGPDVAFSVLGSMTMTVYAVWDELADDSVNTTWVRTVMSHLNPLMTGFWPAQTDLGAGVGRERGSFTAHNWNRLRLVQARYDPDSRKHGFLESG